MENGSGGTFRSKESTPGGLFLDPAGTSRSMNIMFKDGHRKNFYDGKSHMTLDAPLKIARSLFEGAKLIHFNIPNWARVLLPIAQSSGAAIACDIQDVIDPTDPYRRDFIRKSNFLFFSAANHADPDPIIAYFWSMNPDLEIIAGMGELDCAVGCGSRDRTLSSIIARFAGHRHQRRR